MGSCGLAGLKEKHYQLVYPKAPAETRDQVKGDKAH